MINNSNINALEQVVDEYVRYWDQISDANRLDAHYIHPFDEEALISKGSCNDKKCFLKSQKELYDKKKDFKKIHVDLIPSPYMGDVLNAKIFIFMNNPGIGEQLRISKTGKILNSFLGEYPDHERKEVVQALLATLRQDFSNSMLKGYPFVFFNPAFSSTEGGKYTLNKFSKSIKHYCKQKSVSFDVGLNDFSNHICFLQHFPYHCGNNPKAYQSELDSHKRMQKFYQDFLPLLSTIDDRLIIIVRGSALVREYVSGKKIIDYLEFSKGACNRAHFSLNKDGMVGQIIAQHLMETTSR